MIIILLLSILMSVIFIKGDFKLNLNSFLNRHEPIINISRTIRERPSIIDRENPIPLVEDEDFMTRDTAAFLKNLDFIRHIEASSDTFILSENLAPVFNDDSPFARIGIQSDSYDYLWEFERNGNYLFSFNLRGLLFSTPIAYESGLIKLVEGRFFDEIETYSIVISRALAEYNNLHLGSTITLQNSNRINFIEKEVEIIGIFDLNNSILGYDYFFNYNRTEQLLNQIYAPIKLTDIINLAYYNSELWIEDFHMLIDNWGIYHTLASLLAFSTAAYLEDISHLSKLNTVVYELLGNTHFTADYSFNFEESTYAFDKLILPLKVVFAISLICLVFVLIGTVKILKNKIMERSNIVTKISILLRNTIILLIIFPSTILTSRMITELVPQFLFRHVRNYFAQFGEQSRICIGCPAMPMRLHDPGPMSLAQQMSLYESHWHLNILIIIFGLSVGIMLSFSFYEIYLTKKLNQN